MPEVFDVWAAFGTDKVRGADLAPHA